jgi:hypothetical protein
VPPVSGAGAPFWPRELWIVPPRGFQVEFAEARENEIVAEDRYVQLNESGLYIVGLGVDARIEDESADGEQIVRHGSDLSGDVLLNPAVAVERRTVEHLRDRAVVAALVSFSRRREPDCRQAIIRFGFFRFYDAIPEICALARRGVVPVWLPFRNLSGRRQRDSQ